MNCYTDGERFFRKDHRIKQEGEIIIDTKMIRTIFELTAMQSFGTIQTLTEQSRSTSTLFQQLLEEMADLQPNIPIGMQPSSSSSIHNLYYQGSNPAYSPPTVMQKTAITGANADYPTNLANHSGSYANIIKQAAKQYNVPEKLISSVIKHESNFQNNTTSRAGAQGLMQLMPGTAKYLGVMDRLNPSENIMGGTKYLRMMLDQFDHNVELALAAYNAGPGNVKKYGGVPPFKETQQYVNKVLTTFNQV